MVATAGATLATKKKAKGYKPFTPQTQAELDAAVEQVAEKMGEKLIKPRPGAQLKAKPETVEKLIAAVRSGLSIDKAVILCGVSEPALDRWKKANATLSQLLKREEIKFEQEMIGYVRAAAPKDWKAGGWILERRFQWEQRSKTELTGKDGAPLSVSQQLFASMAKAGEPVTRQRQLKNVTPAQPSEQRTNNPQTAIDVKVVAQPDATNDASKPA